VIPFPMIVLDEFRQCVPEVSLPQRNHPIETFFLDRPDKALGVGIRVRRTHGRQDHTNPVVHEVGRCGTGGKPAAFRIRRMVERPTR
jgi:hypothetical protein